MVAKEVFINYYNFNPNWLQHVAIHVNSTGTQVKKGICQGILENLFGAGAGARAGAGASIRICGSGVRAGAERNIFGSATLPKSLTGIRIQNSASVGHPGSGSALMFKAGSGSTLEPTQIHDTIYVQLGKYKW
jgi:hypothetical protein